MADRTRRGAPYSLNATTVTYDFQVDRHVLASLKCADKMGYPAMTFLTKAALIGLIVVTAGCTRPDRFGAGSGDAANAANSGALNGTQDLGGANDPRSPLFFNQTIGDRVLFAVDTSTLTAQGKSILDGQASWLQTNSDYLAIIEGHADEQGTREYNIGLGFRRATAVREYLVSQGVPTNRMRVTSYGKERPIKICSEETCYAQNRRAVTVISIASLS